MSGWGGAGCSLVLGGLGAGFSWFRWLGQFPGKGGKIDRHFVVKQQDSTTGRRIVQSVVDLADDLKIDVVAEGVETEEALEWLRAVGCDMAQGYWLGAPLSQEQLPDHFDELSRTREAS